MKKLNNLKSLFNKYGVRNKTQLVNAIDSGFKDGGKKVSSEVKQKDFRILKNECKNNPRILSNVKNCLKDVNKYVRYEKQLKHNMCKRHGVKNKNQLKGAIEKRKEVKTDFHKFNENARAINVFKDTQYLGNYKDRYKDRDVEVKAKHEYYLDLELSTKVEKIRYKSSDVNTKKDITNRVTFGIDKGTFSKINSMMSTNRIVECNKYINNMLTSKFSGSGRKYKEMNQGMSLEVKSFLGIYDTEKEV